MESKQYATKQLMGHWRNQEEIENIWRLTKTKIECFKIYGTKQNSQKLVYSGTCPPQETRKISNKQPNQQLEK